MQAVTSTFTISFRHIFQIARPRQFALWGNSIWKPSFGETPPPPEKPLPIGRADLVSDVRQGTGFQIELPRTLSRVLGRGPPSPLGIVSPSPHNSIMLEFPPPELWLAIFECLKLPELFIAQHLCHAWQQTAGVRHPMKSAPNTLQ